MIRLLLDQGLPARTADLLRSAGIDAVHTSEAGSAKASDAELIAVATQQHRWIVTFDADFHSILAATNATQPSIIRIRIEGLTSQAAFTWITNVLRIEEKALIAGAAVSVRPHRITVRRLPLGKRK